jgi:hypothetical protein
MGVVEARAPQLCERAWKVSALGVLCVAIVSCASTSTTSPQPPTPTAEHGGGAPALTGRSRTCRGDRGRASQQWPFAIHSRAARVVLRVGSRCQYACNDLPARAGVGFTQDARHVRLDRVLSGASAASTRTRFNDSSGALSRIRSRARIARRRSRRSATTSRRAWTSRRSRVAAPRR